MPPSMCATDIIISVGKKHYFIQNAIKIYTKMHQLRHVFPLKNPGAITNLITNE